MKWVGRFAMRAAVPLAAFCLLALIGVAHAADKAQLSGSWNFNPDQSDDAQQKVQQAKQSSQTRSGGSYPGGGGGYPPEAAIREVAAATRAELAILEAAAWDVAERAAAWDVAAWGIRAQESAIRNGSN